MARDPFKAEGMVSPGIRSGQVQLPRLPPVASREPPVLRPRPSPSRKSPLFIPQPHTIWEMNSVDGHTASLEHTVQWETCIFFGCTQLV